MADFVRPIIALVERVFVSSIARTSGIILPCTYSKYSRFGARRESPMWASSAFYARSERRSSSDYTAAATNNRSFFPTPVRK